LRSVSFTRRRS